MTEKSFINPVLEYALCTVKETIAEACLQCGRSENSVRLLAVTKTVDVERINQAIRLGVRQIGENRVQEFISKKEMLEPVEAHLIGHLQTNKVNAIVGQVAMIESVDSLHLATAIERASAAAKIITPVLVEVNIGGEEAKSGTDPRELEQLLRDISLFHHIHVCGLMTVPPILDTETAKRKVFSKMYQLFVDIRSKNIDNIDMLELSMGMSGDYREAILEGSTIVRVGSAIFGKRY